MKFSKARIIHNVKEHFPSNYEVARITGMSESNVRALLDEYKQEQLLDDAKATITDDPEYQRYLEEKNTKNANVESAAAALLDAYNKLKGEY